MPDTIELTKDKNKVLTALLEKLSTVANKFPEESINDDRWNAAHAQTQDAEDNLRRATAAHSALATLENAQKDYEAAEQKAADMLAKQMEAQFDFDQQKSKYIQAELAYDQADKTKTESQHLTKLSKDVEAAKKLYTSRQATLAEVRREHDLVKQERDNKKQLAKQARDDLVTPIKRVKVDDLDQINTKTLTKLTDIQNLKSRLSILEKARKKTHTQALAQEHKYRKKSAKLEKKYRKARNNLSSAITKVSSAQGKDYLELSKALGDLAKKAPGLYGQTVADFKIACDSAEHQKEVGKVKDDLFAQFEETLKNPSDKQTVAISIDAGVAAGLLGGEIKAYYTISFEAEVSKDAKGRLLTTARNKHKLTVEAKAEVALTDKQKVGATGKASGELGIAKSKIYLSKEDFIENEVKTIMAAIMAGNGGKKKRNFVAESSKLLTLANENHEQLQRNLQMFGAMGANEKLVLKRQTQSDHIDLWTKSAKVDASLGGGYSANGYGAGIALGDGLQAVNETMYKQIPFLDDIEAEPVLQKIHGLKAPKSFGFYRFGDDGAEPEYLSEEKALNELDHIEKDLVRLKSQSANVKQDVNLAEYKRKLTESLGMLHKEYDAYVQLANYLKHNGSNDAKKRLSELGARRGAGDSAEYVKAMSLQFARLRGLYEQCFDSAEDIPTDNAEFNDAFAADLKIPRMDINDSQRKKVFNVESKTDATTVRGFSGFFAVNGSYKGKENSNKTKVGSKFNIAVAYDRKKAPGFPEEENFKLKMNLDAKVSGDNYVADIMSVKNIKKLFGDSSLDVRNQMGAIMRNIGNGSVEFNFTKRHGKWVVKNAKGFAESDKSIGGKVSVGGDIKAVIGLTVKSSSKQVKNIYFGDNTLHALPDVFRAKHFYSKNAPTKKEQDAAWDSFRKDAKVLNRMSENLKKQYAEYKKREALKPKKAYSELIKDLPLVGDMYQWAGELQKNGQDEDAKKFLAVMDSNASTTEGIESALSEFVRAKVVRDDKIIADSFTKRRKLSAEDVGQYAAKQLADAFEAINKDFKKELTDDNNKDAEPLSDVDDLVKKAQTLYKKHKNQRYFDLLKRAHALDFATERLDELTRLADKKDTNEAVAILGTEMEKILASDKVYLNERVDGKLVRKNNGDIEIQPIIRQNKSRTINQTEINQKVSEKFKNFPITQTDVQMEDSFGQTKKWNNKLYSEEAKKQYQSSRVHKKSRLRSFRTQRRLDSRINIADALAQVMQERFKRRQKKQQADQNRRKSSVV